MVIEIDDNSLEGKSKEEIAKERKINANLHSIVDDEYERLIGEKKSIN